MKSRVKPGGLTRSEKRALGWEVNRIVREHTEKNFKVALACLIADYGFGKKRLEKFMDNYNAMMKRFKDFDKDGVFDYEFNKIYSSTGLDPEGFTSEYIPYEEQMRREKVKSKINVTESDASKLQLSMALMGKLAEDKKFEKEG